MKRQLTESERRQLDYQVKILGALNHLFEDEDDENYIGIESLSEGDNATEFIHALSNLVPNIIYGKITGHNTNILEFNHISNTLCFQFSTKEE